MIDEHQIKQYREQGYLLVEGVFAEDEVERMRSALANILNRAAASKRDGSHTWQGDYMPQEQLKQLVLKGFHDLPYHDAVFLQALAHPRMCAILTLLIGPNVQLHHSKMLVKPPERGAAFPLHQDYPYFPHERNTMLAASVHLDDSDMENGCLCVIPGSHIGGPLEHQGSYYLNTREWPLSRAIPCPARAGDVLFFNYLTVHGSDINRSDRTRRNVLFQYRSADDRPTIRTHVDWGQGLMVCGENPVFTTYGTDGPLDTQ